MEKHRKPIPDLECLNYHGTPEKPDIKIFVSHRIDLDSETIDNSIFIPVRCGATYDKRKDITMLGDDTGDNISEKRGSLCELTVQYWAWKNVEADYYGLCHYRRYFSFSRERYAQKEWDFVVFDSLEECKSKFLLDDPEAICSAVQPYDFIAGVSTDFQKRRYDQYAEFPGLHGKDLELAASIVKELYPEFSNTVDSCLNGTISHVCNLFIMKKELFQNYCTWLFSILSELELRMDTSTYSELELRAPAYIAEQLMDIYFTYIKENCSEYKTHELQRGFVKDTMVVKNPEPAFSKENIPIVFACSNFYAPYVSSTIQSIVAHASNEHNYDLLFLHTGILEKVQQRMKAMVSGLTNFSLRFYNVGKFVNSYSLVVNSHFSVETFYRLLIPQFLSNYDKTIYLDSDLIVLRNIADLYVTDIDGYLLAATNDADVVGQYNGAAANAKQYYDTVLKLQDPYSYFQAGVLLLNLRAFRETFAPYELMEFAEKQAYHYVDQDVLNVKCAGRVYPLDMRWNVMTNCAGGRTRLGIIKYAPQAVYQTYLESRKNPYIIHYAGWEKPWNNPQSDFAEIYWKYARQTPFYEVILQRMMGNIHNGNPPAQPYQSKARKLADKVLPKGSRRRNLAKKILPKDSRRWKFCKKIYYKIFKR